MYEQNLINKAMTRREKITKILDKYWIRRGWIESDESMVEARPLTAREELADAIMALPIDVPSEEELEKWVNKDKQNLIDYEVYTMTELTQRLIGRFDGAEWAINEILKRNKIE
jgi:hypothetical protein